MSFLFGRSAAPSERLLSRNPFGGPITNSVLDATGGDMNKALRLVPMYSAVTQIANSVAIAPLRAMRRKNDERVEVEGPNVVDDPGVFGLDRVTWVTQCVMSMLLRGNAYGAIAELGNNGYPTKIEWLSPSAVQVDERGPRPAYKVGGVERDPATIVHIPYVTLPGSRVGLSPVGLFRTQIETGQKIDRFGQRWFDGEGVSPTAIFTNKTRRLAAGEAEDVKNKLRHAVADRDVLVTGNDWQYQALTATPADAQFLESAQMNANQIAAIFHVPPEDIGGKASSSMTYATLEMNMIRYLQRTVMPLTVRIEAVLSQLSPRGQYVKFNLDTLARTDLRNRMESYAIAMKNGILTLPEVRALEDRADLTVDEVADWMNHFVVPQQIAAQAAPRGQGQ